MPQNQLFVFGYPDIAFKTIGPVINRSFIGSQG
jgi:hypothetical protein